MSIERRHYPLISALITVVLDGLVLATGSPTRIAAMLLFSVVWLFLMVVAATFPEVTTDAQD